MSIGLNIIGESENPALAFMYDPLVSSEERVKRLGEIFPGIKGREALVREKQVLNFKLQNAKKEYSEAVKDRDKIAKQIDTSNKIIRSLEIYKDWENEDSSKFLSDQKNFHFTL